MNRRRWIKGSVITAGGLLLTQSCLFEGARKMMAFQSIRLTEDEGRLVSELAETMIPSGSVLGAKDLELGQFVLQMVDDCMNVNDQNTFTDGLRAFQAKIRRDNGRPFQDNEPGEKLAFLQRIANEHSEHTTAFFIDSVRKYGLMGYCQSKYIMTSILPYELVPGRFKGCVSLKQKI